MSIIYSDVIIHNLWYHPATHAVMTGRGVACMDTTSAIRLRGLTVDSVYIHMCACVMHKWSADSPPAYHSVHTMQGLYHK